MKRRKLCSCCETGKKSYQLDKSSAACPYLYCHDGQHCHMYKELEIAESKGLLRRLTDWLRSSK